MKSRLLILLCSALLAACSPPAPAVFANTDLTGATFARHLELADHHGQQRTLADFRGKVVIVFFGYTACPDICPTTLARLAEAMQKLGSDAERVQVLFVSLDPERDSAEHLKNFVLWFHPSFIGLHGNAAQTKAASEEFRVFSARKKVDGELGYVLDHSTGAYVFDPAGRVRLYVKDSASIEEIVGDIRLLLKG